MKRPVAFLAAAIVLGLAIRALADAPTTQPSADPFKVSGFDLKFRPRALETAPTSQPQSALPDLSSVKGNFLHYSSGSDETCKAIKDLNTGMLIPYRDFASTVKVDPGMEFRTTEKK